MKLSTHQRIPFLIFILTQMIPSANNHHFNKAVEQDELHHNWNNIFKKKIISTWWLSALILSESKQYLTISDKEKKMCFIANPKNKTFFFSHSFVYLFYPPIQYSVRRICSKFPNRLYFNYVALLITTSVCCLFVFVFGFPRLNYLLYKQT